MENSLKNILAFRHFFVKENEVETTKEVKAYYNAYLLSSFGIVVDKPELVDASMLSSISEIISLEVPDSFYSNPQDTKYYSVSELALEQLVSYFLVENEDYFERVEIFKHELPKYKMSEEMNLREYRILSMKEAEAKLKEICNEYTSYTRPFNLEEKKEFLTLYKSNYYQNQELMCKENIISLLEYDINFARFLDKKDLVKLSIFLFGDKKEGLVKDNLDLEKLKLLKGAYPLVKSCSLSKKQAKYYNKIIKLLEVDGKKESNINSTYRIANVALQEGNVLEASRVLSKNGSLFLRNLRYLLSRANPIEACQIIDMIPSKNPIVLRQIEAAIEKDSSSRMFTFFQNGLLKCHEETEYEAKWRKSRLNDSTIKLVKERIVENIENFYRSLEPLGKVYVDKAFYKIALPTNTSATHSGLDVLPTGSRTPLIGKNIRTFVYWDGIYDIDASLIVENKRGSVSTMYFGNYTCKPFEDAILFSGDCRDNKGAEYFDIDIKKLKEKGYKFAILCLNGFHSPLNVGEIYAGYEALEDFNTKVWNPKNIVMQYQVKGDTRSHIALGIDIQNEEVVTINYMNDSNSLVVRMNELNMIRKVMDEDYLSMNIGRIATLRGKLVDGPLLADVIFDDKYEGQANQRVIRSYETSTLVSLVNGDEINKEALE